MCLTYEQKRRLAKRYAQGRGLHGRSGGWIYNSNGRPLFQGWVAYYDRNVNNIRKWLFQQIDPWGGK